MGEAAELHPQLQKLLGTVLDDRYAIETVIGAGGMGVVFRGRQLRLRRDVAIKVMNPDLSHEQAARFHREAESAARLDHPNCITVHEFGTHHGVHFMVMPLLDGLRLGEVLKREHVTQRRAVDMGVQILRGIEHAHARGVIHRDIKPDNIVVTRSEDGSELLKVVDFGLAKMVVNDAQWADSTMSFGLLDILAVVGTAQKLILTGDPQLLAVGFPFVLLPMFVVPLVIVSHAWVFVRLLRATAAPRGAALATT